MECKDIIYKTIIRCVTIGIYPEWNVKAEGCNNLQDCEKIGIYPEWNVKENQNFAMSVPGLLEYIQNGM